MELLLQDTGVDPAADDNCAIRLASENGHTSVVELLLQDTRVDPAAADNNAIQLASRNGHTSVVQLLLEDTRVDPAADDNYAIRRASKNGHLDVLRLMYEFSDFGAMDNDPLYLAVIGNHVEVVKYLLLFNVDPSARKNLFPLVAARDGYIGITKLFLKDNRVDYAKFDHSALKAGCQNGHDEIVRLLAPKLVSEKKEGALVWACKENSATLVDSILSYSPALSISEALFLRAFTASVSNPSIMLLLSQTFKTQKGCMRALKFACRNGIVPLAELVADDASFNPTAAELQNSGITLEFASKERLLRLVQILAASSSYSPSSDELIKAFVTANDNGAKEISDLIYQMMRPRSREVLFSFFPDDLIIFTYF